MSEKPNFIRDWTDVIKSLPMTEGSDQQKPYQARVSEWMLKCFGPVIAADRAERNHRFFEEATELVQAAQMTRSEAHQLIDYVYDRPTGELTQEVGGVMTTLAALCLAHDVDMQGEAETELARINLPENVEKIRAKQAAKPKHSPLPTAAPANGHIDDDAVDAFAVAMKEKLADARRKARARWFECDPADLSRMLREHVEKGDPRDVANFCMFLWSLGRTITPAAAVADSMPGWSHWETRIKALMKDMAMPNSHSAYSALSQLANEMGQAHAASVAPQASPNPGPLATVEATLDQWDKPRFGYFDADGSFHEMTDAEHDEWPAVCRNPRWVGGMHDMQLLRAAIAASKEGASHG